MREELAEHGPRLDRLNDRTQVAHDQLRTVQRGAGRLAGRRVQASGGSGFSDIEREAARAVAAVA